MSKKITIVAKAGTEFTFENIYSPDVVENEALAALQTVADDAVWNTGLAVVGDPHIDEVVEAVKGGYSDDINAGILKDKNPWNAKHVVSFRMFRTNEFVYLLPGDKITITAESAEAAAYYAMIHDPRLKVESKLPDSNNKAVTEGDDREEVAFDGGFYLDRTTGIGDADDGNADNGVYPFGFDTAEALVPENDGSNEDEGEGEDNGEGGDDKVTGGSTEQNPNG